jgi:hypothetical protein
MNDALSRGHFVPLQDLSDKGAITTKTKENIMFHIAALPKAERRALSHTLPELVLRVRLPFIHLRPNINLLHCSVHLTAMTATWNGTVV